MNLKNAILALALSTICFTACKKDEPVKEPEPEQPKFTQVTPFIKKYTNGLVEVSKMPVQDTTAANRRKWLYFNFEKMDFVATDKVTTTEWDFGFQGRTASVIWANNGLVSDEEALFHNNAARVYVKSMFGNFDEITQVPADFDFEKNYNDYNVISTASYDREPYTQSPVYWAYQAYDIDGGFTHYIPYANRVHIFKLTDGRYVKFQMINIYNNDPDKNVPKSYIGYMSFRYIISKAGSKDISSK